MDKQNTTSVERILITQLGFIGDVILSTPVIRAVRDLYPSAEISVLTTRLSAPLLVNHPAKIKVIPYDKRAKDRGLVGFLRLRKLIAERQFSTVFSLHRSLRSTLLHWFAGIPNRYGFEEASFRSLYSRTTSRKGYAHDIERNLAILKNVGVTVCDPKLELGLAQSDIEAIQELLPQEDFIAISPGSVWKTKRWTVEGFSGLIRALIAEGRKVVILGSPDEKPIGEVISRRAGLDVVNLIGRLTLAQSAAVISKAKVLVSNDSAPLHFASTFNTPTVALFCATIPEFGFGPFKQRSIVLGVDGLSCRPCGRHGKQYCPTGTHACQTGIEIGKVLEAVRELER